MRILATLCLLVVLSFFGCKDSKKSIQNDLPEISKKEVVESEEEQIEVKEEASVDSSSEDLAKKKEVEIKRHQPYITPSMYFGMYCSPCFGQCPVYNLDIDTAGHAVIEAKRFFDFQGFHEADLTKDQMQFILDKANETDYFGLDHVYDANVTDLPSTLTILQTSSELQWVYDRLNAPEGLGQFEADMDSLIRTLDWKPFDPKK